MKHSLWILPFVLGMMRQLFSCHSYVKILFSAGFNVLWCLKKIVFRDINSFNARISSFSWDFLKSPSEIFLFWGRQSYSAEMYMNFLCRHLSSCIKERSHKLSASYFCLFNRSQTIEVIRSFFYFNEFETQTFSSFTLVSELEFSVCVMCFLCRIMLIFHTVFVLHFPSCQCFFYLKASSALELRSHKINFYSSWQKALVSPFSLLPRINYLEGKYERNVSPPLKTNTTFRLI